MKMKKLVPALALCAFVAAMAGCGQKSDGDTTNAATNTAANSSAQVTGGKQRQIAAIMMQEDQFFRLNEQGMKDAAKKHNVQFISSNVGGALDKEISSADTYTARGVDAILVSPLNPKGSVPALKRAADKGIKIVTEQDAWLAPEAERVTTNILNAHPEINVIWAANEGATVGAVTAIKNARKTGKVVVFGTDMSEQIAGFLLANDGTLQAVTGQKPYEMGFQAVELAVQILDGKKVQKQQILPGVLYSRDKPEEVKAFQQKMKELG